MTVSLVRRGGAQGGAPFTHTIPNDVDATVFTNCKLSAANCADGHGSVWLTVDSDWFGKVVLAGFASDVENVSAFRVAFEIYEVDDAFGVHCGLGLNAVIRSTEQTDLWRSIVSSGDRSEEERYKRINQNGLSVSGAFHVNHFTL